MDIQVHFQCVDTLFDILDMIGAVFYFATQVHIRYDTVSQEAVNTSFHEDRTFRQCLVAILKIRIGYEFQQIVHVRDFQSHVHIDTGALVFREVAYRSIGGER
ncbi:unknown [Parabacteroides johnsonii CAG:246]|nr:unknown [Parabacteroides johnsonii CAG:246]